MIISIIQLVQKNDICVKTYCILVLSKELITEINLKGNYEYKGRLDRMYRINLKV